MFCWLSLNHLPYDMILQAWRWLKFVIFPIPKKEKKKKQKTSKKLCIDKTRYCLSVCHNIFPMCQDFENEWGRLSILLSLFLRTWGFRKVEDLPTFKEGIFDYHRQCLISNPSSRTEDCFHYICYHHQFKLSFNGFFYLLPFIIIAQAQPLP